MKITEVRIKLTDDPDDRLRGFCSITFDDCFVVRDLKIIEGGNGIFVAMPSRKLTAHCPQCGFKNHLRAIHCNQCGGKIRIAPVKEVDGRSKLYADIAHPINSQCREMIQNRVVQAYDQEVERSKQPDYRPSLDDSDSFYEAYDVSSPGTAPAKDAAGEGTPPTAPSPPENAATDPTSSEPRIEKSEASTQGPHHQNAPSAKRQSGPVSLNTDEGEFGAGLF